MSNSNQNLGISATGIHTGSSGTVSIGQTTATGVVVSNPIRLSPSASYYSWHVTWTSTGTVTGTLTVEVSNKENPDADSDTDWVSPQNNTFPANVASDDSSTYEDFHQSAAKWMRLKYAAATGANASNQVDTLYAWFNVKQSG
jgi:hypothetical protein